MVRVISRVFTVCVAVCISLLLLSVGFQQIPVTFAATSTNSIDAYGAEAQIFVLILSTEWVDLHLDFDRQSPVIVVSDVNLVNLQSVLDRVKNGAILVAINLPVDNGLVDVPRHTFGSKQSINGWVFSETLHENVVPPYWIKVVKQTEPSLESIFIGGTADDVQSHEYVMKYALEGVYSALFRDADYPLKSLAIDDGDHGEFDNTVRLRWSVLSFMILSVLVSVMLLVGVIGVVNLLSRREPKI